MIHKHILDSECCPCGSGLTFSKCCKSKPDKGNLESKKPFDVLMMERVRSSRPRLCLHPNQSKCAGKVKNAHALQNKKILSELSESTGHVYILGDKPCSYRNEKKEIESYRRFSRTGVNSATTHTCFCDLHDSSVFSCIEKDAPDFIPQSSEMEFFYAYKAFIFEYYKKITEMKCFRGLFFDCPSLFTTEDMVLYYRSLQLSINEFNSIKDFYDSNITAGTHEGVYTHVVEIPQKIHFACYSFMTLPYDLNGKPLRHLNGDKETRLSITAFPEKNKSYILLSCLRDEYPIYRRLFMQLANSHISKIIFYFSYLLPLWSENIVLSCSLYDNMTEDARSGLEFCINANGPTLLGLLKGIQCGLVNAKKSRQGNPYKQRAIFDIFREL